MVRRLLVLPATLAALGACSPGDIASNTVDAAVFTGRTAVDVGVGAVKVVGRAASGAGDLAVAGVRSLQERRGDRAAGTRVCVNAAGEILGTAELIDGEIVCTFDPQAPGAVTAAGPVVR